MLTIDGERGGGQLVRTALSLSALTGTPFRIEDIRGARREPGLNPQHVAAIELLAGLCDAAVSGGDVGSEDFSFDPGPIDASSTAVDIGTAGSVTLLFDTLLPLATSVDRPFEATITGGTDVKWSPTIAYFLRVKLPLLTRFGPSAEAGLERTGFYPIGGGRTTLRIEPSELATLELTGRGALDRIEAFSKASTGLADAEVAERQANRCRDSLEDRGFPVEVRQVAYVDSISPGSSLLVRGVYDGTIVGFDELGERGKPAEQVADDAVDRFLAFHDGAGVVDEHMADQLLVFLALAGGALVAPRATEHLTSSLEVIGQFGLDIDVTEKPGGSLLIEA